MRQKKFRKGQIEEILVMALGGRRQGFSHSSIVK